MASHVKRETLARKTILEKVDSDDDPFMVIKNAPSAAPISYSGDVPLWRQDLYQIATADETDPGAEPLLLVDLDGKAIKLTKRRHAMPYTHRRVDAEEIYFIHRGKARMLSEVGEIELNPERLVFVTRGVGYRIVPETDDFMALIVESEEPASLTDACDMVELSFSYPNHPFAPPEIEGQEAWEERLVANKWSVSAMKS